MKKKKVQRKKLKAVSLNCPYCQEKFLPDYKNYQDLGKYITDRAKILAKTRTGLCSKHQRRVAQEIKRARHLGLLP